jgi:beta-glucanase (GH16 family)
VSDLRRPLIILVALAVLCTLVGVFVFPGPSHPTQQPSSTSSIENLGSVTPQAAQATPSPSVQPIAVASPAAAAPQSTGEGGNAARPLIANTPDSTTTTVAPETTPTTTAAAAPAVAVDNCGGATPEVPTNPMTGGAWKCTFDDEFNGSTLNRSKWFVQTTAQSGYTAGDDCYMDSPDNVSVSGGVLNLTAIHQATPFLCGANTTQNTSGEVMTYQHFSQTYGFFEVRAKFPDVTVPGLQSTLWLWPVNRVKYGPLPGEGGEIDFAEWFSQTPNVDIPNVHYIGASSTDTTQCALANPATFHTYGLEWTSTSLTIFLDGAPCFVDNWHPLFPLTAPEPFDQPFFLNLTQALGVYSNAFNPATTPMPATTQVDWVRVWG